MSTKTKIIILTILASFLSFSFAQAQESQPLSEGMPDLGNLKKNSSIQNITFDKLDYKKGETAKISFVYALGENGNPDSGGLDLLINLKDESGSSCSAPLEKQLTAKDAGVINLKIAIKNDCNNLRPEIDIKNKGESEWTETFKPVLFDAQAPASTIDPAKIAEGTIEPTKTEEQKQSKSNIIKNILFILMVVIPISLLIGYFIKKKINARKIIGVFFFCAFLCAGMLLGGKAEAYCQIPGTNSYVGEGQSSSLNYLEPGYWWYMTAICSGGTWTHNFGVGWRDGWAYLCGFYGGNGGCSPDWDFHYSATGGGTSWSGIRGYISPECWASGSATACVESVAVSGYTSCPNGFAVMLRGSTGPNPSPNNDITCDNIFYDPNAPENCGGRCLSFSASQFVQPCTPGDCAANTCAGQTCVDSCGTTVGGTKPCNGTCGTTGKLGSPPIVGSCSAGTPSNFKLDSVGHWSWICLGAGGTNAPCNACVDTCTPNCTSNTDTKCKNDANGICQVLNYTTSCSNYGANGKCNAAGTACTCVPNEDCNESEDACKSQSCDSGCVNPGTITGTRRCVTIDDWKEVSP
jgi:hypothetical protein